MPYDSLLFPRLPSLVLQQAGNAGPAGTAADPGPRDLRPAAWGAGWSDGPECPDPLVACSGRSGDDVADGVLGQSGLLAGGGPGLGRVLRSVLDLSRDLSSGFRGTPCRWRSVSWPEAPEHLRTQEQLHGHLGCRGEVDLGRAEPRCAASYCMPAREYKRLMDLVEDRNLDASPMRVQQTASSRCVPVSKSQEMSLPTRGGRCKVEVGRGHPESLQDKAGLKPHPATHRRQQTEARKPIMVFTVGLT